MTRWRRGMGGWMGVGGGKGCIGRGGSEGGVWLGPPLLRGSPYGPRRNVLKRKSSWHRRRRSKILDVSLKHWKGRRRGRGPRGGGVPPPPAAYDRSNTSLQGTVSEGGGGGGKRQKAKGKVATDPLPSRGPHVGGGVAQRSLPSGSLLDPPEGGGGGGTRPWCWFGCPWQRPLASCHCTSRPPWVRTCFGCVRKGGGVLGLPELELPWPPAELGRGKWRWRSALDRPFVLHIPVPPPPPPIQPPPPPPAQTGTGCAMDLVRATKQSP